MAIKTISPHFLELPYWLNGVLAYVTVFIPVFYSAKLFSNVPTYQIPSYKTRTGEIVERWKSSTPNEVGIILMGSIIFLAVFVLFTSVIFFIPYNAIHMDLGTLRFINGLMCVTLIIVLIIEYWSIKSWVNEFYDELFPSTPPKTDQPHSIGENTTPVQQLA